MRRAIKPAPLTGRLLAERLGSRDTVSLDRNLIGVSLVCQSSDRSLQRHRITEVEAYDGPEDRAFHASKGRTPLTQVMFGPPGHWYVYLCYGMHEMLNLVTGPVDYPAAILIRGVEGISGPGRLTKLLDIDRRFNSRAAFTATGLWIEDDGWRPPPEQISATPRIGVTYAGPEWAGKPWRFVWSPRDQDETA